MELSAEWRPRDDEGAAPTYVDIDIVHSLALIGQQMAAGSVLASTLQVVADGIVSLLGFGVAAVNHRRPDGDFEVVAVSGEPEARAVLEGAIMPRAVMDDFLTTSVAWGGLRFGRNGHIDSLPAQWVPGTEKTDDPRYWHPDDILVAPMHDLEGELVGVLSVDLPPAGLRPDRQLCELLEVFATQAGLAIASVELRERYLEERAATEHLLTMMATRDPLTGLGNRRALKEALDLALAHASQTGQSGALIYGDLDGFKALNDRLGHLAGDSVLTAWGVEICQLVRKGDTVCRVGGDEFVVVAQQVDVDQAAHLLERIRDLGGATSSSELGALRLSAGMVPISPSGNGEVLLREADAAMYREKRRRRPGPTGTDAKSACRPTS